VHQFSHWPRACRSVARCRGGRKQKENSDGPRKWCSEEDEAQGRQEGRQGGRSGEQAIDDDAAFGRSPIDCDLERAAGQAPGGAQPGPQAGIGSQAPRSGLGVEKKREFEEA
jgi:hypothetical protein